MLAGKTVCDRQPRGTHSHVQMLPIVVELFNQHMFLPTFQWAWVSEDGFTRHTDTRMIQYVHTVRSH